MRAETRSAHERESAASDGLQDAIKTIQEITSGTRQILVTELTTKCVALEEKFDYSESVARSEEDGWFYDKTDGDWENNLTDPDSE